MKKVFIDGSAGTTGLRIFDRLNERDDIKLTVLSESDRKDPSARKQAINEADIAFLCLPDAAAVEAVQMTENPNTVVIDTSTAHRTNSGWAYGFPELSPKHEEKIKSSKRIAVPGCHASGFIALVYPLIESGLLSSNELLSCFSLTGYSGGGKKMIAEYESETKSALLSAGRQYALSQTHKHLKEMTAVTGLKNTPIFSPIVGNFYSGMQVTVPIFKSQLQNAEIDDIKAVYSSKYTGDIISFSTSCDDSGFLSAATLSGKDSMKISVYGNEDRILLTAVYDNLGKGASGAAIECLNIVMGKKSSFGLDL